MDLLFLKPWELHPMLVHFPIAFLLGGTVLLFWNLRRSSETLLRVESALLLGGVLLGWLAAAAGGLAYFTVPAHTEAGHGLMLWHLGLGLAMLTLFSYVSMARLRTQTNVATKLQLTVTLIGALLLIATGHIGGTVVFHHGAGVDPQILSREIREGHTHAKGHADSGESDSEHLHQSNGHQHEGH